MLRFLRRQPTAPLDPLADRPDLARKATRAAEAEKRASRGHADLLAAMDALLAERAHATGQRIREITSPLNPEEAPQ